MRVPRTLRRSLLCALALVFAFPFPAAAESSSRVEMRVGYETDPGEASGQDRGDTWAGVTAGRTLVRETGGPLSFSLDLSLGATAYARLTDLDRLALEVRPALDYVVSPRVTASFSLVAEGRIVQDADQSAWGWGGSLRLREQLSPTVDLSEYVSYRDLRARDELYSGTNTAAGCFLRVLAGERWTLGAGGEYARGDYLSGHATGPDPVGTRRGSRLSAGYRQAVAQASEEWVSGSAAAEYSWSARLSSGVEYVFSRALGEDGGGNQHAVTVTTTLGF